MVYGALTTHRLCGVAFLCALACLVRSLIFYYGVMPYGRYKQPDSNDYHAAAQCITHGFGMTRPDTKEPIFWRTPGYPVFLSCFYRCWKTFSMDFPQARQAQQVALWVQIGLCSLLPALMFYLALCMTHVLSVAWLSALISVFHVGFCLASTYLLTDGIALLFFILFLIFLYKLVLSREVVSEWYRWGYTAGAAFALSVYTWIRPMGELMGAIAIFIIISFGFSALKKRTIYAIIFTALFFGTLSPWYVRNYCLTGKIFFCPITGIYLNCFSAPKIIAREDKTPLLDAYRKQQKIAGEYVAWYKKTHARAGYYMHPQIILPVALAPIKRHPWWFFYDWMSEVFKTTYDLYSSQLVSFVNDCFWYDPLQEFLSEKICDCLYKAPLSPLMRTVAILELIFYIILWVGLFAGIVTFIIKPFFCTIPWYRFLQLQETLVWLIGFIIASYVVLMTGGFGYARMRIPSEPLMIILSLSYWHYFFDNQKNKTAITRI